jgi:two-component system, OmpR family, sensor histidine kinase VicK
MEKYNLIIVLGVCLIVLSLAILVVFLRVLKNGRGPLSKGQSSSSSLATSLRDEKLKFGIILNAIEDGVVLIDDQHTIQLFNPGAGTIIGWNSEDAIGINWQAVFKFVTEKGEPLSDIQDPLVRLFDTKKSVRDSKANLLTKSGKIIAISLVISPILDSSGTVTGAVSVFRDVSEDRQAEHQRAEFISTASHEMRTPVAAIEGYLALALNDKVSTVDARARSFLEKAHASTQHLGELFQDLLTSAKVEDGRLTSHPEVVEIGAFLEQLTSDLRFSAERKGLSVEFTFGTPRTIDATIQANKVIRPLYYAFVDPDRLREAVTNLFDNAVKYTDQGKISLGVIGNDQTVQFYVRDNGPGIPAEDIPHLFQKFYRVDNSTTRTIGGTGLGLFICRKIIELYEGRIWVESEFGHGSTFYINLPRLSTQKAEELKNKAAKNATLPTISSLVSPL